MHYDNDVVLFIEKQPLRSLYEGECHYCKVKVERNTIPSNGHYTCSDCKKKRQMEREIAYRRKNGQRVRKAPKPKPNSTQSWDKTAKRWKI